VAGQYNESVKRLCGHRNRIVVWGVAVLAFVVSSAVGQVYPDAEDNYVNDFARVLTSDDTRALRSSLEKLEREMDVEGTVVVVDTVGKYGGGSIESFATGLFNKWGVGNKERNDGFMILVSVRDRKFRIELGEGYGTRHNERMGEIARNIIPPYFKTKDYGGGLRRGVDEVVDAITSKKSWTDWVEKVAIAAAVAFFAWRRFRNRAGRGGDWRGGGGFGGGRSSGRGGASGGW
jgi:uncharacterized membrane protein YgcG